jgi:hypothetical protein
MSIVLVIKGEGRMSGSRNPYPEFLIDEASGIKVASIRHQIWAEGHKAGKENKRVIKTVIKSWNGMVLVFDNKGEQMPKYQGRYEDIKESILKDAPPEAIFSQISGNDFTLEVVPRAEW